MGFKSFLIERADSEEQLKHLEHAEDHVINAGPEGFVHAFHNLNDVHSKLKGEHNSAKVTMKYDGSPSVVFGHHPKTGKFFVASKSVFNKNPKVNYTEEDIEKNHGHAPGLVSKLKAALKHLPKVSPKKGVYQGDLMHTPEDLVHEKGKVSFTPNTITYSVPADSAHGQAARKSKLGIAVHTAYEGKDLESMKAKYAPDLSHFGQHDHVHMISTNHDVRKAKYTPEMQKRFIHHMKIATKEYEGLPKKGFDTLEGHRIPLKTYINATVRHGTTPSIEGFQQHYEQAHMKKVDGVKTDKAKAAKTEAMKADLKHIEKNKDHFTSILRMHDHLQKAKDITTHALSSHSEFEHTIGGKKTKPEGFVVVRDNRPTKFVDRADFSAANFNKERSV
jgi:hypothetical protein